MVYFYGTDWRVGFEACISQHKACTIHELMNFRCIELQVSRFEQSRFSEKQEQTLIEPGSLREQKRTRALFLPHLVPCKYQASTSREVQCIRIEKETNPVT